MATDYIIFIHGVNVRNQDVYQRQAREMFKQIQSRVLTPSRTLKPVVLFWGNVGEPSTNLLLSGLNHSSQWNQMWFRELRSTQVLTFVGDAALYLSRAVSAKIVQQITDQAIDQMGLTLEELKHPPEGDRLHLVTHSWGTVVLFDILFAPRWEDDVVPPVTQRWVENIRRGFFGLGDDTEKNFGIPLASIHTMGSPIALFNLVNIKDRSSFDLTPKLKEFLRVRQQNMQDPLVWKNYCHPGDPISYPLEGIMPLLLGEESDLVSVEDIISPTSWIGSAFGQSILPIINGGKAHGSYWSEKKIAQNIAEIIQATTS